MAIGCGICTHGEDIPVPEAASLEPGEHYANDDHHLASQRAAHVRDLVDGHAGLVGQRVRLEQAVEIPVVLLSWVRVCGFGALAETALKGALVA
jgi:hypothetical protein